MDVKELVDLFLELNGKAVFLWNIYIVGLIAIAGWLVSSKSDLSPQLKTLITLGIVLFAVVTIRSLGNYLRFLEATQRELLARLDPGDFPHLYKRFERLSFSQSFWLTFVVHVCLDAVLLVAVWSPRVRGALRLRKPNTYEASRVERK
jgi:hypothetical protein